MQYIKTHAGIRGVLALIVLPLHINLENLFDSFTKTGVHYFAGSYAVDIFFLLSGYIICKIYIDKLKSWSDLKKFFTARYARILPLHYLTLLIVGLMFMAGNMMGLPSGHDYKLSELFPQLFLVQSLPWISSKSWIATSWSLSMEMLAYTLTPMIILLIKPTKNISILYKLIVSSLMLAATAFLYDVSDRYGMGRTGGWIGIGRVLFCYTAGAIISTISMKEIRTFKKSILGLQLVDWLTILIIIAYFMAYPFKILHPAVLYSITGIWLLITALDLPSWSTKIFGSKLGMFLGEISFSIYLIHPIIGKFVYAFHKKVPGLSPAVITIVAISLVMVVSILSFYLYERPMRNFIRSRTAK